MTHLSSGQAADPPELSRRERHKQDRWARIHAAALGLFTRQGFGGTTVRQIAQEADVATGTVFRYAADKADLLLLVFHDVIEQTAAEALDARRLDGPLAQVLPRLFDPFFAFYEERPALARDFLHLVLFHDSPQRNREMEQARRFVGRVAELLAERQAAGEVAAEVDPHTAALALFSVYQACLVLWLAGDASADEARAQLWALLALQHRALQVGAAARHGGEA